MYGPDMSEILADLGIGLLVILGVGLLAVLYLYVGPILNFKLRLWGSKNLMNIYSGKDPEKKPKKNKKKKM